MISTPRRKALLLASAALTGLAAIGFVAEGSMVKLLARHPPIAAPQAVAEVVPEDDAIASPEVTSSVTPRSVDAAPAVEPPPLAEADGRSNVAVIDDEAFGRLVETPPARPSPPAAPSAAEAETVRRAIEAYRDGKASEGDAIRLQLSDPAALALADWTALRAGIAVGYERIAAFHDGNPDWPVTALLRRRAEEALLWGRKPGPVVRAHFAKGPPTTPVGKFALALALRAEGDEAGAVRLVRDAWREDTFGRDLESRILAAFPDALATADHRFRMERFLLKESWGSALRAAERAGKDYVLLAKARVAVEKMGKPAEKALAAVPERLRSDLSYRFSQARFYRRKDRFDEAAKILADAPRDAELLVDGDTWWHERRALVRELLDEGEAGAAYQVASRHAAESDAWRIEAEFHAGWIALRFLKSPNEALKHFAAAARMAETPISVTRGAYWQGRAAEAAALPEDAERHYRRAAAYPIAYYGQLARAKLGWPKVELRELAPADEAARAAFEASRPVQALKLLHRLGIDDLALALYADLAQTLPDAASLDRLATLATDNRLPRAVLVVGKMAVQRGFPLDQHAYPDFGVPEFETVGDPVEAAMVYAITRQESAFNPKALSTAGARGLMQLMPATAQRTARRFKIDFDVKRLTADPAYNAKIGAAHLGELMEDWRGSHILVFASYNAGGGNVAKWVRAYGDPRSPDVDLVDWIERIPFSETRNYVQRVVENLNVYRHRLQDNAKIADRIPGSAPALSASAIAPEPATP